MGNRCQKKIYDGRTFSQSARRIPAANHVLCRLQNCGELSQKGFTGKSVEPSIDFIRAIIEGSLPFKDDFFDVIICIGVLNFTKKGANEAVQEFARVLKPNGLLLLYNHSQEAS